MAAISELEAYLRDHPADWQGWLVYADHLTDGGDVRGRLICLEHQLATADLKGQERQELQDEAQALVRAHHLEWFGDLRLPNGTAIEQRHGFVHGLRFFWDDGGNERWKLFIAMVGLLEDLVLHPIGRLLTALKINHVPLSGREVALLAGSEALVRLTRLELVGDKLGPDTALILACSPQLCSLGTLNLARNSLGSEGARALARSSHLRSLTSLDVRDNDIDDEAATAMAASETLRGCTIQR